MREDMEPLSIQDVILATRCCGEDEEGGKVLNCSDCPLFSSDTCRKDLYLHTADLLRELEFLRNKQDVIKIVFDDFMPLEPPEENKADGVDEIVKTVRSVLGKIGDDGVKI